MLLKINTERKSTPVAVIQGTYNEYCAPSQNVTSYDPVLSQRFEAVFADIIVSFVSDPNVKQWLEAEDRRARFNQLVKEWLVQRGAKASMTQAAMCPAYQTIIGMGGDAVPLLLKRLESEGDDPDHWFWALKAITGNDPVPETDRGNLQQMATAWLNWGRQNGYGW